MARFAELPGRHRAGRRCSTGLGSGPQRRQAEAEQARQEWVDRGRDRQRGWPTAAVDQRAAPAQRRPHPAGTPPTQRGPVRGY